jgi:hypothetical protein
LTVTMSSNHGRPNGVVNNGGDDNAGDDDENES